MRYHSEVAELYLVVNLNTFSKYDLLSIRKGKITCYSKLVKHETPINTIGGPVGIVLTPGHNIAIKEKSNQKPTSRRFFFAADLVAS